MSGPVTKENYRPTLAFLWGAAQLITDHPIEEMIAAAEHAESVGPIVDPTLYREKQRDLHEDLQMLRALLDVKRTIQDIARRRAREGRV